MTTTTLSLTDPLRQFAVAVRLPEVVPKDALEVGLAHIEAELERIALDAYAANRRGAPLSDAVVDFANYPHLARVHAFVDDILTLSLPAEVVDWVESLLSMPEPPSWEGMRTALVSVAGDDRHPRLQALAQFALFEAVRLNLVVMTRWFPDETLGVGMELGDLDIIAEERVEQWLCARPAVPIDVRPFHVIVHAALYGVLDHLDDLRQEIEGVQDAFLQRIRRRAEQARLLSEFDIRDALLIRNEAAPLFDEQRLTVELLQERHLVLQGAPRNTLDQRLRRFRVKPTDMRRRRRVALLDLLRERSAGGNSA